MALRTYGLKQSPLVYVNTPEVKYYAELSRSEVFPNDEESFKINLSYC